MEQSSKQSRIIPRIVRILSPTNNSQLHNRVEKVRVAAEGTRALARACAC